MSDEVKHEEDATNKPSSDKPAIQPKQLSVGELSEEENDVSRGYSSSTQQSQGEQLENQTIPHERGN